MKRLAGPRPGGWVSVRACSWCLFLTILRCTSAAVATTPPTAGILRTTETQVWDGSSWKSAGDSLDLVALPTTNAQWTSKWKQCSDEDWNYVRTRPHQAIRQRTWERSYETKQRTAEVTTTTGRKDVVVPWKRPVWMQAIRDDWNFKGFGWTFYKTLWTLNSCGVALRLPLTANLDSFERHPALPSLSASLCLLTNPLCIVLFANVSLRLEFVQWACRRSVERCVGMLLWVVWTGLIRGVSYVVAAVLFPLTRTWPELSAAPKLVQTLVHGTAETNAPVYSRTVEERLGWSCSWRFSQVDGYEYRTSYWHFLAPTLTGLWQGLPVLRSREPPAWFRRRSAAWGLSTSAPSPDPPHVTTSGILSLSGYQFTSTAASTARKEEEEEGWWTQLLQRRYRVEEKVDEEEKKVDEEKETEEEDSMEPSTVEEASETVAG
jgi:hypothetical protein